MSVKHVIFLGAGASLHSGYPLANELRLRLSSAKQLEADLRQNANQPSEVAFMHLAAGIRTYLDRFAKTFEIFRHGTFGSVDEFSKLAALSYPQFVIDMKRLMELALILHNPEDTFAISDYYPFVQKLFKSDLKSLKEDVTVLSYNYDCYLDFLLLRAQSYRNRLCGVTEFTVQHKNQLSSGFFDLNDNSGLSATNQCFRHFKLHGSIAYADEGSHNRLFKEGIAARLKLFDNPQAELPMAPVVFPWELFNEQNALVDENDFIFVKHAKAARYGSDEIHARFIYRLYKSIWEGARKAVQEAQKVSFVGLSMHEYLRDGLQYLFNRKEGDVKVVVANSSKEPERILERVSAMLRYVAIKMTAKGSWQDPVANMRDNFGQIKYSQYGITPRNSFRDFIEKEME